MDDVRFSREVTAPLLQRNRGPASTTAIRTQQIPLCTGAGMVSIELGVQHGGRQFRNIWTQIRLRRLECIVLRYKHGGALL